MTDFSKTTRNTVKRNPKRGHYDKATVYEVLDAGFLAHVGFVIDGQPFVIPTAYGRFENKIYFHGATTSRMMVALQEGIPCCVSVTHVDGLVLARSSFHHSINYRSVVLFGKAEIVEGEEKDRGLFVMSEQILKGRWDEVREPNEKELKATTVLAMEIESASAKIRTGPPVDDKPDYELPVWAGVVPLRIQALAPLADPQLKAGIEPSKSLKQLKF